MLQQGRIDVAVAALGHYRERDQVVDFSIPYLRTPLTMLVKKSSSLRSLADFADKRVGTTIGSGTPRELAKFQPKATVQTFEGYPDAFLALQQDLIDAIGTDIVILASLRANASNPDDYLILGDEAYFGSIDWGVGVRENDSDWRDTVNVALQDIYHDGRWDEIFDKWLGKDSKLKLTREMLHFDTSYWP
jgi:polar amino acid transport system substrate-binding protein